MRYRRHYFPGATVFLTLVTHERAPWLTKPGYREALRLACSHVQSRHAFKTLAFVVMPDHCHLLWAMPEHDADFSMRLRLIKHHMARKTTMPRLFWQKRFWEHIIRDDENLTRLLDYIHYNPVKHGQVRCSADWPDSSFNSFVDRGVYARDWAAQDGFAGDGRFGE